MMLSDLDDHRRLYKILCSEAYRSHEYERIDLGEDMGLINSTICGYWKPCYIVNHATKCGYEFMNRNERLQMVTHGDINWASLRGLPAKCLFRAENCIAVFPIYIYDFKNGVAEVQWQLQPDGRYWMDDDGYGMTDEERVSLYGFIDTECRVVVPFQTITDQSERADLRSKAEAIVKGSIRPLR